MIFKRLLIIFIVFIPNIILAQQIRLNKDSKIDTLCVWINYSSEIDTVIQHSLDSIFYKVIYDFNCKQLSFKIIIDSSKIQKYIFFNVGKINFVDNKRSILTTALDITLITGHVIMIANYGWTFLIWPFLFPATYSNVELDFKPKMIKNRRIQKIGIASNGYFMKKDKQLRKFKIAFYNDLIDFYKKIDKQNKKIKKH